MGSGWDGGRGGGGFAGTPIGSEIKMERGVAGDAVTRWIEWEIEGIVIAEFEGEEELTAS